MDQLIRPPVKQTLLDPHLRRWWIKGAIGVKYVPLYYPLRNRLTKRRQRKDLTEWEKNGRPDPPPHLFKQRILHKYAQQYKLRTLVETGTYYGDMVEAMKDIFHTIYSIELSPDLYKSAKRRFKSDSHVHLIFGDSGEELKRLIDHIDTPSLFWLDGHYSGGVTARGKQDTPIYDELKHIFAGPNPNAANVIIIDDARCFGTDPAYPTIEELQVFVHSHKQNVAIQVEHDSIRIIPIQ
jgi:hypothetical protein